MSLKSDQEQLGSAFLRWILNIADDVDLDAHIPDAKQSEVLSQLSCRVATDPELFKLREHCGASAFPRLEEPLDDALAAAADSVYPFFLLALHRGQEDPIYGFGLPIVHSQIERNFNTILAKTPLMSIRAKSASLLTTLLYQSWVTAILRGTWDHSSFRQIALDLLQKLRTANQGTGIKASLFIGFGGVEFSSALTEGDVCLRPLNLRDFSVIFGRSTSPAVENTSLVAEIALNYDLKERFGDTETLIERWPVDIALAFALSNVPRTRLKPHEILAQPTLPSAPRFLWFCFVDPLDHNGMGYDGSNPWITPFRVSDEQLGEVKAILAILLTHDVSQIRVALSRVMLALHNSRHLQDTLVDAVIAWENIGRAGVDFIKFKLSAVMAYLVGEPSVRGNVRANLANIYMARNSIVHGGQTPPRGQELLTQAHRALDVAFRAINTMLRDEPKWLTEKNLFDRMFIDAPPEPQSSGAERRGRRVSSARS